MGAVGVKNAQQGMCDRMVIKRKGIEMVLKIFGTIRSSKKQDLYLPDLTTLGANNFWHPKKMKESGRVG